jgi:hypothetical protein
MSPTKQLRLTAWGFGASTLLLLSGCAASFEVAASTATPSAGTGIHHWVHGGQSPIASTRVFMFVANTIGYAWVADQLGNSLSVFRSGRYTGDREPV